MLVVATSCSLEGVGGGIAERVATVRSLGSGLDLLGSLPSGSSFGLLKNDSLSCLRCCGAMLLDSPGRRKETWGASRREIACNS